MSTLHNILVIEPLGDCALVIHFAKIIHPELNQHIHALAKQIRITQAHGISDIVPSYQTLAVFYQPEKVGFEALCDLVTNCNADTNIQLFKSRQIDIPVCYEHDYSPDIALLAKHCQLTIEQVIERHSRTHYTVYFLGFKPGFAYLGDLDASLHMPRKSTPRLTVPAGSVGIGGAQTGIYPQTTPGGWQIIGRTPLRLFDPTKDSPCLLQPGDTIRFVPISMQEFEHLDESP
jgi:KipI family sensor histidine kinase inhibitor